jgi:hypothetical protein
VWYSVVGERRDSELFLISLSHDTVMVKGGSGGRSLPDATVGSDTSGVQRSGYSGKRVSLKKKSVVFLP